MHKKPEELDRERPSQASKGEAAEEHRFYPSCPTLSTQETATKNLNLNDLGSIQWLNMYHRSLIHQLVLPVVAVASRATMAALVDGGINMDRPTNVKPRSSAEGISGEKRNKRKRKRKRKRNRSGKKRLHPTRHTEDGDAS